MKLKTMFFFFPFSLFALSGTVELRGGYFYPSSHLMRDIYHSGGVEGEFEATVAISQKWNLFANTAMFNKKGESVGLKSATRVQIYPLSIGLKHLFPLSKAWGVYLGGAPTFTWAFFHDKSPYVEQKVQKRALGLVAKSGFIYAWEMAFIDFFFDYYFTEIDGSSYAGVTSTARDIGGFKTGMGIGLKY